MNAPPPSLCLADRSKPVEGPAPGWTHGRCGLVRPVSQVTEIRDDVTCPDCLRLAIAASVRGLSERQLDRWIEDRERQATQHPDDRRRGALNIRGVPWSRGDHYRRKNNGIALRTYRGIKASP